MSYAVRADLDEALENNYFDIVVVATPDDQHFDKSVTDISANRPRVIFAEKPVCLDPLQLRELNDLTTAYDVQLLINHSRRINPNYSKLKDTSSKFIGNIIFVNAYYYNGWIQRCAHC